MMHCTLEHIEYRGFEALRCANRYLELVLIPALGGKIVSLRQRPSGREWLWQNPHLTLKPVVYDGAYVTEYDTGGFDECFPSVSAGKHPSFPWLGTAIPDHGELWCQSWESRVEKETEAEIIIEQQCHGVRFPYRFSRRLVLNNQTPSLELSYQVTNPTPFEFPFVWSSHPLLRIEPGMRIELPEQVDAVVTDTDFSGQSARQSRLPWPTSAIYPDLGLVRGPSSQRSLKLFTPTLTGTSPVSASLVSPNAAERISFTFHPQEIPHIGLWMNYGGWSGSGSEPYFNLGLEPCIGQTDGLSDAVKSGEFGRIPAKGGRSWTLTVGVR